MGPPHGCCTSTAKALHIAATALRRCRDCIATAPRGRCESCEGVARALRMVCKRDMAATTTVLGQGTGAVQALRGRFVGAAGRGWENDAGVLLQCSIASSAITATQPAQLPLTDDMETPNDAHNWITQTWMDNAVTQAMTSTGLPWSPPRFRMFKMARQLPNVISWAQGTSRVGVR